MLVEITNGLAAKGHDVTIIMPASGAMEFSHIKSKLIRTNKHELGANDYPYSDAIVSNFHTTTSSAQAASVSGKGKHIRFSLCYEPMFLPEQSVSFPTFQVTDKLIVLSKYQQELIFLNHGIKGKIVPIGVGPEFRNLNLRKPYDPLQVSAIVRMPEGGWAWHRRQDYLISQLDIIKTRFPAVKINLICPPGEYNKSPALQMLAKTPKYKFFTPANDTELCYIYNQTDIFVASSIFEAAPLPGLEAMKCGAALVATYAGGNMEYCRHEENCLLSYGFENRLGHDIIRLIENVSLRQQLAVNGQKEAEKWSWQNSVNAFEKALLEYLK
jgi:glycosyltransferase involved in cell wall biosynthesis